MPRKIQIGVLEDHIATATGYKSKLEKNPALSVAWIANYFQGVESHLQNYPTHLLILDIEVSSSPDVIEPYPVLHAIPKLLETFPELKIVVISMHNRPVLIKAVKTAGASGYILKDDVQSYEKLDRILIEIYRNDSIYFSPEALKVLKNPDDIPSLTPRQNEILSLIASNPTVKTKELAEELFVSPSTIRNHLSDIYLELGVNSRSSAVLKAHQLGLIAVKLDDYPFI
ncbi:MAG: HTH domain-containing protein [Gammaproteobacteria bacterium]|nr:HTH domain-containing protein [Gammaproteobacteria bacterium]